MRSCVFRILFRMYEIKCMNIRLRMWCSCEKWRNMGERRCTPKFTDILAWTNLWKTLWTVCITFCINSAEPVGACQNRGRSPNIFG